MGWLRCAVYRIILYIKPDANWNLFENYCLIMLVPPLLKRNRQFQIEMESATITLFLLS